LIELEFWQKNVLNSKPASYIFFDVASAFAKN
jgi:hypothetical protein